MFKDANGMKKLSLIIFLIFTSFVIECSARGFTFIRDKKDIEDFFNKEIVLVKDLINHSNQNGYGNKLGRITYPVLYPINNSEIRFNPQNSILERNNNEYFFLEFLFHVSAIRLHKSCIECDNPLISDLEELVEFYDNIDVDFSKLLLYYNIYALYNYMLYDEIRLNTDPNLDRFLREHNLLMVSKARRNEIIAEYPETLIGRLLRMDNYIDDLDSLTYGILKYNFETE